VDWILEGDIRLTVRQAQRLLVDARKPRRRKRKLAEPVSKLWTLPIPYTFDGSHSSSFTISFVVYVRLAIISARLDCQLMYCIVLYCILTNHVTNVHITVNKSKVEQKY